jgi:hypothetical protein
MLLMLPDAQAPGKTQMSLRDKSLRPVGTFEHRQAIDGLHGGCAIKSVR